MERSLSTSKVRIVCLPLPSAHDQAQTWTYFVPSKKMNSARVPLKNIGASGILLQPAIHGKKNSSCRNRSPKRRQNDFSPKTRNNYANELKSTPAGQAVIDSPLPRASTIDELPASQKHTQMHLHFLKNEGDDRLKASNKDEYMSLLSLVSSPIPQKNNHDGKQEKMHDRFFDFSTRPRSLDFCAAEQSLQDNHHYCTGAEANQKQSDDKLPPNTVELHDRKGGETLASSCHALKRSTDSANRFNSFSMRNATGSDLSNQLDKSSCTDSVSKVFPKEVESKSFGVSPDCCHESEAKTEDCSSDELCIVSVRSLALGKDEEITTCQDETVVSKPLGIKKLGQYLLLKPSPRDPSKRILYLHVDYTMAKPVSDPNMSPEELDTNDYKQNSDIVKKSGRATKITSAATRKSRKPKLLRKREMVKSNHTVPRSKRNEFSNRRKKSVKRVLSNGLKASAVSPEETAQPSPEWMVNGAAIRQKEKQSTSDSAERSDTGVQKTNSRISQLRAMLRKKEADLEKVRKSLINFDDSMPG